MQGNFGIVNIGICTLLYIDVKIFALRIIFQMVAILSQYYC